MSVEEKIIDLVKMMEAILDDRTVPKNIRRSIEEAIRELKNTDNELSVRINGCVSILDEIATDPNIPLYTRTEMWNIVSMVEKLNDA